MMQRNSRVRLLIARGLPLVIFVTAWEVVAAVFDRTSFLIGRPSAAGMILLRRLGSGVLLRDTWVTLQETMIGFIVGNLVGIAAGLALWRWGYLERIIKPYLVALGAVPVFALAPVLVLWFGTGLLSKIVLVFLSTVLVATFNAHAGASEISPDLFRLFRSWRASDSAVFRLLVLPSAATWVLAGLRLNIGFALLGAFIGEFISAEAGLAHQMLIDAGLYNISAVWVGIAVFAAIAILLNVLLGLVERVFVPWRQKSEPWFDNPGARSKY